MPPDLVATAVMLLHAAARSTEAIYRALGDAFAAVTENDCLSWFVHCGY